MYAYVLKYYNVVTVDRKIFVISYIKIVMLTSYNIFSNIIIVLTTLRVIVRISDLGKVYEVL